MRILFVHAAFPGSFRHLAARLAAMPEHEVFFASEYGAKDAFVPGVRRIPLEKSRSAPEKGAAWWNALQYDWEMMTKRSFSTRRALSALRQEGIIPDIVCFTAAMGHGLFVRDVFPESFCVFYADCYYPPPQRAEEDIRYAARRRFHNVQELNGLVDADLRLAATEWQKRQFPAVFQKDVHILPYGVDTDWFSPAGEAAAGGRILFSPRCTEAPFFPEVLKRIPEEVRQRPGCRISVMVNGLPPRQRQALESLAGSSGLPPGRLSFVETKNIVEYRDLLRSADVYVYLTNPFALSGGLFEAMSCGCLTLCSDTEPVREIIRDGENGFLCKQPSAAAVWKELVRLMDGPRETEGIRKAAREYVVTRHSLKEVLPVHMEALFSGYGDWRAAARHLKKESRSQSPEKADGGVPHRGPRHGKWPSAPQ